MAKIKTKARALDLLGRQQIAGIPTALSELFKNAHDAYADNVEVDYSRKNNILILRDNGLGMTREEFEERWLTLGTDSKLEKGSIAHPVVDETKNARQVMGEKGIGRLAIAAIGPQVLVMTRAKRGRHLGNLVAAFINWTLFTLPSLDLSDIEIPMQEISDGDNLTKEDVQILLNDSKENVQSLSKKLSTEQIQDVCDQIDEFKYDPPTWTTRLNKLDEKLGLELERGYLRLDENGYGTHFIISPINEILPDEIEQVEKKIGADHASRLQKALLGFTNTMQEEVKPPIIARFRDHTLEGECIDRIGESIFFTPQEFKSADHHFKGVFNEFGQFRGTIQVYGQTIEDVVLPWLGGRNKETDCGSFEINLGYVQGSQRDSRLSPELWKHMSQKTSLIGGLYIYRDGIRVLPYGDSDVDFLGLEYRRTKSAAQYYFSYRNMLGYINLTKKENGTLEEKAGREGFIENRAYKQFRAILENFFITIAADYFVDKGELSDLFIEQRSRQQEQYELLRKREKLKSTKKKKLKESLEIFFSRYDAGLWKNGASSLTENIEHMFDGYDDSETEFDDFVFEVQEHLRECVSDMQEKLKINIPVGVGFGKEITDLIDIYQVRKKEVEASLIEIEHLVEKKLVKFEDKYGNRTGLRRRFDDSLKYQQKLYTKQLNELFKRADESKDSLTAWFSEEIKTSRVKARESLNRVNEEFASTSFANKTSEELYQLKRSLEDKIEGTTKHIVNKIEALTSQLSATQEGTEENTVSSSELTAALESEYEHLKEQHESSIELVQLGMALGVIHHEFNSNIISIRRGLREMQPWAEKNIKLLPIYEKIRVGFDHLDGYLRTFTPLTRRLSRKRVEITGRAVSEFVTDVFHERLEKDSVKINFTSSFMARSVVGFTSTIYPAFVNLIDNAIYWVSKSTGVRTITLDADGKGFVIRDSGPGVPTIDHENVFEFGFSKRIGGRGMGLYVAKQTLENDNFTITLDDYSPESGAVFRIHPIKEEES